MTRHTWRPGDAIDPGAVYYPMDGARQGDPLEPDDVIAALDAHMEHTGIVDAMAQEIENLRAELDGREKVELPPGWSDAWLGWHGAECSPLPGDTMVQDHDDGHCRLASTVTWTHVRRFRYQGGWLPRGEFIPPAELWDEGCPVRCEWTCGLPSEGAVSHLSDDYWDRPPRVQYIRLVARQPQAGLPEGFRFGNMGGLLSNGAVHFTKEDLEHHSPAAIRQAVDAWLRELGDE